MRSAWPLLIVAIFLSACASRAPTSGHTPAAPAFTTSTGLRIVPVLRVPPVYPRGAQYLGTQGCVFVSFQLDNKGRPTHLQAMASVPNGVFDKAAIGTVSKWRFRVTDRRGLPAPAGTTRIGQTLIFQSGADPRATRILHWICYQPPPRTLIAMPATAGSGLHITRAKHDWVDVVHMPDPQHVPLTDGEVDVGFCVDRKGQVQHAKVKSSTPGGLYDQAAIAALKSWAFTGRKSRFGEPREICGLSYRIPVIGAAALARGPVAINQRPTAVPVSDLPLPHGKVPWKGRVTVQFCVEPDGAVRDAKVLRATPDAAFDRAAIQMVRIWQYWPKTVNGTPVRSCNVRETVVFRLGRHRLAWVYPASR